MNSRHKALQASALPLSYLGTSKKRLPFERIINILKVAIELILSMDANEQDALDALRDGLFIVRYMRRCQWWPNGFIESNLPYGHLKMRKDGVSVGA